MKYILILICMLCCFTELQGFFGLFESRDPEKKYVDRVIGKGIKFLSKKYNVEAIGTGVGRPDKVEFFGLSFSKKGYFTVEEARLLIISMTEDFLKIINEEAGLRPYMLNYPFTPKNVMIDVFIKNKYGDKPQLPYLIYAVNSEGLLIYRADNPTNPKDSLTILKESFEEGLQKLNH